MTETIKSLLCSNSTEFIMEAHNALSARIVEESGFKGIWASGLTISASAAVRDSNELSWTQVLDNLEFMKDAVNIPILVDGDTGYGNFNNVRRLVQKLCNLGISGLCIEDKLFPKTNSFVGENQPLTSTSDFCSKIKAGKDFQTKSNFSIIARTEALVSGLGINHALERAHKYHEAGADAILIHSKQKTADEVIEFTRQWKNKCPLVIVPTKYHETPTSTFKEHNISMVIWANHLLRASLQAMKDVCKQILANESVSPIESKISSLDEVFSIVRYAELKEAEKKYAIENF